MGCFPFLPTFRAAHLMASTRWKRSKAVWLVTGLFFLLGGLWFAAEQSGIMAQNQTEGAAKPDQAAILKTFREEFVPITPGKGQFPKSFEMGSSAGKADERPRH